MAELETVCVYCGSSDRVGQAYLAAAGDLGRTLAEEGLTILYGGGAVGLMGALADAALGAGGRVIGVRPRFMSELESPHPDATEMVWTQTMHERKQWLCDRADAFVALPGAIGTLDELIETITWKRLGLHNRPICALDVDGFFDPLRAQFQRMVELELVPEEFLGLTAFVADAASVMDYLRSYAPQPAAPMMWSDD